MAVTGILIVIALILALQIDRIPKSSEQGNISTDVDLADLGQSELNDLEVTLAGLKDHLDVLQSASRKTESKAEVETEISRLEGRISGNSSASSGITDEVSFDSSPIKIIRHKAAEIVRLREEIRSCEEVISLTTVKATRANDQMMKLENQVKVVEAKVMEARARSRKLQLIRELSDTTKEPVIVDVSDERLKVMRFDKPGVIEVQQLTDFQTQIRMFKKQDQYFVLYFRPSGAPRFEELRRVVKDSGFEIGYEAIEENAVLSLGAGGGK
jgi:hypothetical protein